jgi:hypothetical protein
MKYERKSDSCVVAFFKKDRIDYAGRPFKATTAARAVKESGGYRIDYCGAVGGAWLPWEPIDSVVRKTLRESKKAIEAFAAEPAKRDSF